MSNASGEPEPGGEQSSEEEDREFSLSQLFVTLQLHEKKSLKKCRSLPSSISQISELETESSFDSTMVFEKRGYFYESVGGVFYTLEWPVKSSTSEEMPPNCEDIANNETDKKTKENTGKFYF